MLQDGVNGILPAFWQQRIGNAAREVAIRLIIDFDECNRNMLVSQFLFNGIHHVAGCAIARIHHDLERFDCC